MVSHLYLSLVSICSRSGKDLLLTLKRCFQRCSRSNKISQEETLTPLIRMWTRWPVHIACDDRSPRKRIQLAAYRPHHVREGSAERGESRGGPVEHQQGVI